MTREIPLTHGLVALVDEGDFGWLSQFRWHTIGKCRKYAVHQIERMGVVARLRMHNLILPPPRGMLVDHINRNSLDNRRSNLRVCTSAQNNQNRVTPTGKSGYRGVIADRGGRWRVTIIANKQCYSKCGFTDAAEAARYHDILAAQLHGEFAILNFPPITEAA